MENNNLNYTLKLCKDGTLLLVLFDNEGNPTSGYLSKNPEDVLDFMNKHELIKQIKHNNPFLEEV